MFNQKEMDLLKDLRGGEELCIEKYGKFAQKASSPKLEAMLDKIKKEEEGHLKTLEIISSGITPPPQGKSSKPAASKPKAEVSNYSDDKAGYDSDKYLCTDALSTEKHVSSVYDTSIFEFKSPKIREILNHIQKEEQVHGELIYSYMAQNGMYN